MSFYIDPYPLKLHGLNVVPHPLAETVRVTFTVERIALRRRRRYFVKRTEVREPGCYQSGITLYMHPTLVAKLKAQIGAAA